MNTFGLDEIPETTEAMLADRMKNYRALKDTKLTINQNKFKNLDNIRMMEQIRYRDSIDLLSQGQRIVYLENELGKLQKLEKMQIPFDELTEEVKINYNEIESISFSNVINSNFKKLDTLSVFLVKWNDSIISNNEIPEKQKQLEEWLKVKYKDLDSLVVKTDY